LTRVPSQNSRVVMLTPPSTVSLMQVMRTLLVSVNPGNCSA
jgi:hypothetical protein